MSTERLTNQDAVFSEATSAPTDDQSIIKVMTAPVVYVRENPKCCFCPDTYKVYIHSAVISDGNFDILRDPLFDAVDIACCACFQPCSALNFLSPADPTLVHYNIRFPTCCEQLCARCCNFKDCCKCSCDCSCISYQNPLYASYGATSSRRFGYYARRVHCCALCSTKWEFFGKMDDSRYIVEVDCCQAKNPCNHCYPLNFYIKRENVEIGKVIRSPRSCCGTYTYEIQFPSGLSLEDRLLLIAFCCKRG